MKRVLIADDSSMARTITKRCMEIAGFRDAEFIEANDGLVAFTMLLEKKIDILITDLTMPRMDGMELIQRMKTTTEIGNVSVIVVTSAGNPAKEKKLMEQGVLAVINKPVSPAKLAAVLIPTKPKGGYG